MSLINAVYFKGVWRTAFTKETKEYFTDINGKKQKVNMMRAESITLDYFYHYNDGNAVAMIKLPYGSGAYSMYIVSYLDESSNYPVALTEDMFNSLLAEHRYVSCNLSIPSFSIDGSLDLEDGLKALGVRDAFTPAADFSNLCDMGLFINKVFQKSHISVGMSGTEASAATEVTFGYGSLNTDRGDNVVTELSVDMPFTFLIREESTGTVLFIGQKVSF